MGPLGTRTGPAGGNLHGPRAGGYYFGRPRGFHLDCALAQRMKSLLRRAGDQRCSATSWNWPQAGRAPRARGERAMLRIAITSCETPPKHPTGVPGGRCLPALGIGHSGEKTVFVRAPWEILPFQLIVETQYFPFKAWRAHPSGVLLAYRRQTSFREPAEKPKINPRSPQSTVPAVPTPPPAGYSVPPPHDPGRASPNPDPTPHNRNRHPPSRPVR